MLYTYSDSRPSHNMATEGNRLTASIRTMFPGNDLVYKQTNRVATYHSVHLDKSVDTLMQEMTYPQVAGSMQYSGMYISVILQEIPFCVQIIMFPFVLSVLLLS